jgi:hypothetical protein
MVMAHSFLAYQLVKQLNDVTVTGPLEIFPIPEVENNGEAPDAWQHFPQDALQGS